MEDYGRAKYIFDPFSNSKRSWFKKILIPAKICSDGRFTKKDQ